MNNERNIHAAAKLQSIADENTATDKWHAETIAPLLAERRALTHRIDEATKIHYADRDDQRHNMAGRRAVDAAKAAGKPKAKVA